MNTMTMTVRALARAAYVALLLAAAVPVHAQIFAQPDREPRVDLRFDRYYDYDDLTAALTRAIALTIERVR